MHTSEKAIQHGKELTAIAHESWQREGRSGVRPVFLERSNQWELTATATVTNGLLDPTARLARMSLMRSANQHLSRSLMTAYLWQYPDTPPRDFDLGQDHFLDILPEIQESFLKCEPEDLISGANSYSLDTMTSHYEMLSNGLRNLSDNKHRAFDGTTFSFNIGNNLIAAIRGQTTYDQETVDLSIHDTGKTLRQRKGDVVVQCGAITRPSSGATSVMTTEQYTFPSTPFPEGRRYLSETQQTYLIGQVTSKLLNGDVRPTVTPPGHRVRISSHLHPSPQTTLEVTKPLALYTPTALR